MAKDFEPAVAGYAFRSLDQLCRYHGASEVPAQDLWKTCVELNGQWYALETNTVAEVEAFVDAYARFLGELHYPTIHLPLDSELQRIT